MTRFRFLSLLCLVFTASACGPAASAPASSELKQVIEKGALIVDVRTPEEYAGSHYPNAINIPVDQVANRVAEFGTDKNRPIIVYCRSGNRSGMALRILQEKGFSRVYNGINQGNMP